MGDENRERLLLLHDFEAQDPSSWSVQECIWVASCTVGRSYPLPYTHSGYSQVIVAFSEIIGSNILLLRSLIFYCLFLIYKVALML